MKHKVFLGLIIFVFTIGSIALADYVEPTATAPNANTPEVLKTDSVTVRMHERIGTGNGNLRPASSLFNQGPYIGVTEGGVKYGTFSEKFVATGVSTIANDLFIWVGTDNTTLPSTFDQYTQSANFKPLQVLMAGRYISPIAITSNHDITANNDSNNFDLDLKQSGSGSTAFNPTTNIGLGNWCTLYPADIGVTAGDGGGCPNGSYMTMYKNPTFSGTLSSSNNTNSQPVGTCTYFDPASNPSNMGRCPTERVWSNLSFIDKQQASGGLCKFTAATNSIGYPSNTYNPATFTGKNVKIKWYQLGGNPPVAHISSLDNQKSFNYGCGASFKVVVTDDYGQYAEAQ